MFKRLKYLWPYLQPHRRKLALGLATILASVLLGLASPLLVGHADRRHRATAPPCWRCSASAG